MPTHKKTRPSGTQDKGSFSGESSIKDIVGNFLMGVLKNLEQTILDSIKTQVQQLVLMVQKGVSGSVLMLIGLVFLLIGIAIGLNELIEVSQGIGYAVVGLAVFVTGYIIIKR